MTALIQNLIAFLDESKADDIKSVDLKFKSDIADFFVIASGQSYRHLKALADKLKHFFQTQGLTKVRLEGVMSCEWVVVDAGDIVVHLFHPETRGIYNLEKIWHAQSAEPSIPVQQIYA